jgi:hypothetical protein
MNKSGRINKFVDVIISNAISAAQQSYKKKRYFVYMMLADMVFIFFYGFLSFNLISRLQEYIFSMGTEIASRSAEITQQIMYKSVFEVLVSYPEISGLLSSIFWMLILIIFVVYIVFSIFQGFSWRMSLKIIGKEVPYHKFFAQFVILNVLWLVLFYCQRFFYTFATVMNTISNKLAPGSSSQLLNYISFAFLALVVYFAFISYPLIGRYSVWGIIKKTFSFGVKKAFYFIPMYLIIIFMLFIVSSILHLANNVSIVLFFIAGFILLFPLLAFARVYIASVVNHLVK